MGGLEAVGAEDEGIMVKILRSSKIKHQQSSIVNQSAELHGLSFGLLRIVE